MHMNVMLTFFYHEHYFIARKGKWCKRDLVVRKINLDSWFVFHISLLSVFLGGCHGKDEVLLTSHKIEVYTSLP